jgi:hypothetical protein
MTILDWSEPNRTPRPDPCKASRQGRGDHAPPVSPAQPLTGSLADHDALAEAVDRYRASYGRPAYEAMRDAATRCGMPQGEPPLSWSVRRLATYQHMMESAS